jgi:hypothetical protein
MELTKRLKWKLFGLTLLTSMFFFPGTWIEVFGTETLKQASEILKNITFI